MTKEKAQELLKQVEELKKIKAHLMGWTDEKGYTLDQQLEGFLRGVVEGE